ncbi:excinuclease ABC subunit UvrA [Sporolactobacillus sp. Y61]|uniref:UvrABC system protein A n=1 Tax=Sporolactobacillus sp. Y61 TaxID=3160863 RepID=A0AAU8IJT3_9BACL
MNKQPENIEIYHARTHNLKDVSLHIPLHRQVAITGVSGSGKSSLAMGVLYSEGSRRYLEGLSAFARRKIHQAERADVERIDFLPPALALRQRPPVPGRRSTVGTMTELYNLVRLIYSRLGTHRCPRGHQVPPSMKAIFDETCVCPVCGAHFNLPSAESFSFNSAEGACPDCGGLGERAEVDPTLVVPDPELTLEQGAVASWRAAGRGYTVRLAALLGVRLDVPWKKLTDHERDIVLNGPETRRPLIFHNRKTGEEYPITFTYDNAVEAVRKSLAGDRNQTRYARMRKFLSVRPCETCGGLRLRREALQTTVAGKSIAEVTGMSLSRLDQLAAALPEALPVSVREVAGKLSAGLRDGLKPLLDLGVGYLTLDRQGNTLSTGERQRLELSMMAGGRSTGVLYILDEPSVGLHPANVDGLKQLMRKMVANGNSLIVVDHNLDIIRNGDYMIEMGPGAGDRGGTVVARGTPHEIAGEGRTLTGRYLSGSRKVIVRQPQPVSAKDEWLRIAVRSRHNLHHLTAGFPLRRMTAVTGVSGAGKTALVFDCLVPALKKALGRKNPPDFIESLKGFEHIRRVVRVDATPIGRNARSTPATYTGLFDGIRRLFAGTDAARKRHWSSSMFSFNVKGGRCEACEGRGEMLLDMQYLPEQRVRCPHCNGTRYRPETLEVKYKGKSIADVLRMSVDEALRFFTDQPDLADQLETLHDVGLGYLLLGEATPGLSGGEAQRIKLAGELKRRHTDTLYVLDEPSTGLHVHDIEVLLGVLDKLMQLGATIILIDHDPDVIANCDYVLDLGPGGGSKGGRIIAEGTPAQVAASPASLTGKYLPGHGRL